ncbi:MAG TPA: FKBP-type peptidyl-prolyl cis-trans isomerase [Mycobacteriales bacterium]|nr:FKBP-type peptidyl-prolyl cis-trans isomerase [Mycobacteriales bacterium]
MATSRRRERELARRRYERRRLREMERRAKQRRRNTIVGASAGTVVVIVAIVLLAIHLAGGSSKSKSAAALTTPTPAATTPSATPPPDPCAGVKPTAAELRPKMPKVGGTAPKKLVVTDLKKGTGTPAKAGDTLCVTYVGADYKTGKVFDASYKHGGTPFAVTPLGSAPVIKGWNQGLVGIRPGGIRELVIPPDLGYGPSGQPPTIQPNETLVFLVAVQSVKPA